MPIYKTSVKRNGLQQYRVRINYTDKAGKHKQLERTAYGRAEALDLEQALLAQIRAEPQEKPKPMTVQQLAAAYAQSHASEVRLTTMDQHKGIVRRYITPHLGDYTLDELTPERLEVWKTALNESGLATITKKNAFSALRAVLNYAVRLQYLPANPLQRISNFRDPNAIPAHGELHYYTAEQFRAYIAAAKAMADDLMSWGIYTFFAIAFYTGMRKGEINALRWNDIEGSTIHVRRSVAQKIKGQSIVETPPKNKSSYRDIQIPAPLKAVLDEHRARQQMDSRWNESYRICGGIACLGDTTIDKYNRRISAAAGLPRIRIHDFRHSHASLLVNEGINIQEVARRLGHSDVQMTWSTYSHLYPREEERALKALNAIQIDPPPAFQIPEKSPNKSSLEKPQVRNSPDFGPK